MARCIVMDASGDSRHEFDTSDVSARTLAQQQFKHLTGSGFRAVALDGRGGTGRLLKQFDPQVAEVFGPALVVALRQHGAEAPLITSVVLEAPPPRAWIGFSNTDRVCVSLRPRDLPALCQHYEASDRRILFSRLLVDAQLTYERIRSPSFRWNLQSYFRRPRPVRFVRGENRSPEVAADTIVHERAMALLKQSLSTVQLEQYEKCSYFDVKGSHSGKRYRIHHGRSMNVDQLDKIGRRMRGLCFYPRGDLVAGDVMLAQKLALELFEVETLKIANRIW